MAARLLAATALVAVAVLVAACGTAGSPSDDESGTVSLRIVDAVTQNALADVEFEACPAGGECAPHDATAQGDGLFTLRLPVGTFTIRISTSGYLTADYRGVAVVANQTIFLEQVLLIDEAFDEPGDASGVITDAFEGTPVPGAELALRSGFNTTSGSVVASVVTDAAGTYGLSNVPAGYYTADVSAAGFVTSFFTVRVIGGQANPDQNAGIAQIGASGQVQIVLTWGADPSDLDSHLTGPTATADRFHVYYIDRTYESGGTIYADLDLDDTTSFGPETISIYQQIDGTYRYSVHDYSNRSSTASAELANSGAQVRVYREGTLTRTFNVPSGAGTLWTVFELNGSTITPVNTMSYESSPVDVTRLAANGVVLE